MESGGTPEFRVRFFDESGRAFDITLRERDYTWHVWLPGRRYGSVRFSDDHKPDTFRIARVRGFWFVRINGEDVVSSETPRSERFRRSEFEIPKAGRLFLIGNVKTVRESLFRKGEQQWFDRNS